MNKNLVAFLVSKDRPLQAEFCLHSFYKNLDIEEGIDLYILAKSSTEHIRNCYEEIAEFYREKYGGIIMLGHEQVFCEDFLSNLEHICQYGYCCYITDDTCFYQDCSCTNQSLTEYLRLYTDVLTLSLRLGLNTSQQDPENPDNKLQIPSQNENRELIWDWTKESRDKNTGYAWSMDGNIYRTRQFYNYTKQIEFNNLREWEGGLIEWSNTHQTEMPPLMSCFAQSCAVNIPMNFVQPPYLLTQGPYGRSIHELQNLYNLGYRIDLEKTFKDIQVVGSHQFIDYKFSQKDECR